MFRNLFGKSRTVGVDPAAGASRTVFTAVTRRYDERGNLVEERVETTDDPEKAREAVRRAAEAGAHLDKVFEEMRRTFDSLFRKPQ